MDPDEATHYEPPDLDLCCLHIQVFSFLGLRNNTPNSAIK